MKSVEMKWWQGAVAYQIYPKSFMDSNGDGIGDLNGITGKLDYLRELGIDLIWLSPVNQSPMCDNGYDISDYYAINPAFGTNEDMYRLIDQARERGIRVVMDLVVNHCSDRHEWFQRALADPQGEYGSCFYFRKGKEGCAPNNWRSIFGGSAWERVSGTDWYYLHLFTKQQPDLNWENPALREEIYRMMNFWLEKGVSGFRLDAITYIKKEEGLPSYEPDGKDGMVSVKYGALNRPGIEVFLNEMKERTYGNYDAFTVGEVAGAQGEEMLPFISLKDGFFSTIFEISHLQPGLVGPNFFWCQREKWDANDIRRALFTSQLSIQPKGWLANAMESHDTPRSVDTYLPPRGRNFYGASMLAVLYFCLRGTPFIYQGQEIGMRNIHFDSIEEYDDCSSLSQYQYALEEGFSKEQAHAFIEIMSRDNARYPVSWDSGEGAGFTRGTPWMKVNPDHDQINIETQRKDPGSLLSFYKRLIALKKSPAFFHVLALGELQPVLEEYPYIFAYSRDDGEKKLFVICNYHSDGCRVEWKEAGSVLLNNYDKLDRDEKGLCLEPFQAVILEAEREPFTLTRAILRTRDGAENILTCEESGQEKGASDGMRFSGQAGQIKVEKIREGGRLALKMTGGLHRAMPYFGYQPALAEQEGMALELSMTGEMSFVSIYQHKEWWTRPAFGTEYGQIPKRSQLVVMKDKETYHIFLAVSEQENRADLEGFEGGIRLTLSSNLANQTQMSDLALVYARGKEPYSLIEDAAQMALRLTGKGLKLRREKRFPGIFEKIGWCTWDSLGQKVNEKAILEKMDEFREKNLPIAWVLIDDGWSLANQERLTLAGLDADPEKFPKGIGETVRVLKQEYQVEQVGVWQAVKGYWCGVEEGSQAEKELGAYLTRYPNGELTVRPQAEAAFGFWNRWHAYLKRAGVDFIKVDSQSSFSIAARGSCSYGKLARAVHTGLEASADLNFGGNLINCMGMAPEDVWNRQSASLSRNSDDFTPTVRGSFTEHALQNAYNAIYHGCFYWCDWDMVWSIHEDVRQNMMIRLISGGPVYLSDGAGNTDPEQIWPVILEDGSILRCQDVARPTLDCLTRGGEDGNGILKIYNRYEDVVYVAAIPVKETAQPLEGSLRASDLPAQTKERTPEAEGFGACGSGEPRTGAECSGAYCSGAERSWEKFWVYDWKRKEAFLCGQDTVYPFSLAPKDAELFHLIPQKKGICVVGITDKYISAACVEVITVCEGEYLIRSKSGGEFAFLTQEKVKEIRQDGVAASFERRGDLYCVPCAGMGHTISVRLEA